MNRKILCLFITVAMILTVVFASVSMAEDDQEEKLSDVATETVTDAEDGAAADAAEDVTDAASDEESDAEDGAATEAATEDLTDAASDEAANTEDGAAIDAATDEDNAAGDWTSNGADDAAGDWTSNGADGGGDWTSNGADGGGDWTSNGADDGGGDWTANVVEGEENEIPYNEEDDSSGYAEDNGLNLTDEAFRVGDIPDGYLEPAEQKGTVECIYYKMPNGNNIDVKSAYVYLPAGYENSTEQYNVMYLLHAADGDPTDYLDTEKSTKFQRLIDHMIEDGVIDPLIIVAPTYFPNDSTIRMMPLMLQVTEVADFPDELVEYVIPAVEGEYRTYAETTDEEGIIASRDHRAIAGFSLGGIVTWDVFLQKISCARWYLPISEASWDDGNGGIEGIWNSDLSAEVLYEAVQEQGCTSDDFMLFVATGTEDVAFDIATSQMASLLEYDDMFITSKNTSCSMMIGGTHSQSAIYTYMYHIMPDLFKMDE